MQSIFLFWNRLHGKFLHTGLQLCIRLNGFRGFGLPPFYQVCGVLSIFMFVCVCMWRTFSIIMINKRGINDLWRMHFIISVAHAIFWSQMCSFSFSGIRLDLWKTSNVATITRNRYHSNMIYMYIASYCREIVWRGTLCILAELRKSKTKWDFRCCGKSFKILYKIVLHVFDPEPRWQESAWKGTKQREKEWDFKQCHS